MCRLRDIRVPAVFLAAVIFIAPYAFFVSTAHLYGDNRATGLSIREDFHPDSLNAWELPFPDDWEILKEGRLDYLHMKRSRDPGVPRRPLQFIRLKGAKVGSFTLNVKVRRAGGSMIVVFNYVDTLHFYYVHLSKDPGTKVDVHNGIFIVDGGPRRRIAGLEASPALPDLVWHDVRIVRDVRSGSIQVFLDKETSPRFSVIDHTFTDGQVGLGSFDETGDFALFRLYSNDAAHGAVGKE
jgi:hypothetical protein